MKINKLISISVLFIFCLASLTIVHATSIDDTGRTTLQITFKNGNKQRFTLSDIARIEFIDDYQQIPTQTTPVPSSPSTTNTTGQAGIKQVGNWDGLFGGEDKSSYPIEIRLTMENGIVSGGYSYFHKANNKSVKAIITETSIQGDTLTGRWKQVEGIIAEGRFVWKWLPGLQGKAFEGSFDSIKYWGRMNRK